MNLRGLRSMNTVKNDVQLFHFEEQQVRTVERGGEPWFALSDVCKVLGISNVTDTKKRLNLQDLDTIEVLAADGKRRKMGFINESGLYDVILDSRKPQAKQFRRWVTSEVLPAIRKHGGYLTEQKIEEVLLSPDTIIQLAQNLKAEQEKRLIAEAERAAAEALAEQLEPKANDYDKLVTSKGAFDFNRVAKNLGIGRNKMLGALRERKVLMQGGELQNVPYQRYAHHFEVKMFQDVNRYGKEFTSYTVRVKPSGVGFILNKLSDLVA